VTFFFELDPAPKKQQQQLIIIDFPSLLFKYIYIYIYMYIGLVVVQAKRKDINGFCTKKDKDCKGKEIRDSQYNDMKTSMYLLGNAFRLNQTKAPDNLPSVRAAKKFFKEMDLVEKATKKGRKNDRDSVIHYAAALEALDTFLDLVELPPTDSGWYEREFSRATGDSARIT
ncbi:MAG: hypothetical protein ACI90V_006556, partial [Bacillariaceae sp.]|jgi:hypothetical protein